MLIELSLQRLTTVLTASSSAEMRSLYLLKRRDSKRFILPMAMGDISSSTAPFRFLSHETLAAFCIALISFFSRCP